MQSWLFLAVTVVVAGGAFVLLGISSDVGLYIPPAIAQLGRGAFDYINLLFLIMWAWMFQLLSVNDGFHYQLTLRKVRVPRSRASDVWSFIVFTLVAVLWGVLGVHAVFSGRAVDPTYVNRLPSGVPASSLQHGVVDVTTTYFVLVGLVLVLIVVTRLFNPIDLDEYDRYLRRVLRQPPPRTPVQ